MSRNVNTWQDRQEQNLVAFKVLFVYWPVGARLGLRRLATSRPGRLRAVLVGVVAVLGVQGCAEGAPSFNVGSWVRSPYVAAGRNEAVAAFATWMSALRQAGLTPHVQAAADGCGKYVSGGGGEPVTDWGVSCGREVVVTVAAPDGVQAAQALIVRALTKVGWARWHGTLAIPSGCGGDDLHGLHSEALASGVAGADLTAWRLTCSGKPGVARYGPAASGCPAGPFGGWVAWSWHEHVCRPVGVISSASAQNRILIGMFELYAGVDEGTSTNTVPPPAG